MCPAVLNYTNDGKYPIILYQYYIFISRKYSSKQIIKFTGSWKRKKKVNIFQEKINALS